MKSLLRLLLFMCFYLSAEKLKECVTVPDLAQLVPDLAQLVGGNRNH